MMRRPWRRSFRSTERPDTLSLWRPIPREALHVQRAARAGRHPPPQATGRRSRAPACSCRAGTITGPRSEPRSPGMMTMSTQSGVVDDGRPVVERERRDPAGAALRALIALLELHGDELGLARFDRPSLASLQRHRPRPSSEATRRAEAVRVQTSRPPGIQLSTSQLNAPCTMVKAEAACMTSPSDNGASRNFGAHRMIGKRQGV